MIEFIPIGKVNLRKGQAVPPFLESLVAAAARGDKLDQYVDAIVSSFGFDTFEYGISATPRPDSRGLNYIYATTSVDWVRRYDRMGYIEVDPRIFLTCKSAIPMIWDQSNIRGHGENVDEFIDDARHHGIASGVAFMWHGPWDSHIAIALNSRVDTNAEIRLKSITRNLPDIVMFAHYFHEVFMLPGLKLGKQPRGAQQPLSKRERECLALAAQGMTTKAISSKLEITSRTVQFHFERIRVKLGASNRHEAIARGVQTGIIRAE